MVNQEICGILFQMQMNFKLLQCVSCHILHHDTQDGSKVFLRNRLENNDIVDTVQKFRSEQTMHLFHHARFNELIVLCFFISAGIKAETLRTHDLLGASIGRHDDDRILKGNRSTLGIGNVSIVQHLQQNIQHIRMSLFNFIKKNNRIGISTHLFAELSSLVIADIAWRGTDHFRNAVLLHVFGHIDTDKIGFRSKHRLGQCLTELRFSHACRAKEHEGANRALRILQTYAASTNGSGHCGHSFRLSDHTTMKGFFKVHQSLRFSLRELFYRNSSPLRNNLCNIGFSDMQLMLCFFVLPFSKRKIQLRSLTKLFLFQLGSCFKILSPNAVLLFCIHLLELCTDFFDGCRLTGMKDTKLRGCLIDEINGLIREETIIDVSL